MRLLIMGPPGVGKGTQARGIAAHYEVPAISTGDIFRANVRNQTPLGQKVAAIMAEGGYVPDEITDAIVRDRLGEDDAAAGWLLDGYPRTLGQVEALDGVLAESGTALDAVISLVADEDVLVERLLKRAEIEGRADDNADTIRNRMAVYNQATDPLLAIYRDRGLLVEVDGIGTIEEVGGRITAALDQVAAS
ncbi:MAG: adenylate kinase [Propionicimonas sp.]|uniref:adenylate kinase n=1 Tax=Propionicimonas sp. TaxID=1955623 RepID=UPI002B20E27D|nr:adenylate kinase [Propionicimonas sp.]MEA4942860.1 adenylate kinase [Propionicimonas sp.]MEA5054339.1 adenylate kinase [Propionicimonas sp.]MEA5119400.1 adenylate kinase [Propionicimonas sp.]